MNHIKILENGAIGTVILVVASLMGLYVYEYFDEFVLLVGYLFACLVIVYIVGFIWHLLYKCNLLESVRRIF